MSTPGEFRADVIGGSGTPVSRVLMSDAWVMWLDGTHPDAVNKWRENVQRIWVHPNRVPDQDRTRLVLLQLRMDEMLKQRIYEESRVNDRYSSCAHEVLDESDV